MPEINLFVILHIVVGTFAFLQKCQKLLS